MMSVYTLRKREGTETFHRIVHKRKWVGRVVQHEDGAWLGVIGKLMVKRPTKTEAFDDVVAQHLGYANGAVLRAKNAKVRAAKKIVNGLADEVYKRMLKGDFKALDTVEGLELAVRGFTRDLRRK